MKQQTKAPSHGSDLGAHKALPQPYQRLFSDGRPDSFGTVFWKNILADLKARPTAEVVDTLTRMSLDRSYVSYSRHKDQDVRSETPARALHALAQLGPDALPAVTRVLPLLWTFDDTVTDAVVEFYRSQGPTILPFIDEWLNSSWNEDNNPVAFLTEVLGVMPADHPECRGEVTALLRRAVENSGNGQETVAWCIFCLLELEDRDAIDTILAAFQANRVDTEIITLQDVLDEFNIEIIPDSEPGLIQVMPSVPRRERNASQSEIEVVGIEEQSEKKPLTIPYVRAEHVGRNHPCPCGSGKKYKKCCGLLA